MTDIDELAYSLYIKEQPYGGFNNSISKDVFFIGYRHCSDHYQKFYKEAESIMRRVKINNIKKNYINNMDAMDEYSTSGDWTSTPSSRQSRKLTEKETFKKLDELDIEYIETYLRKKKIKKIKKDLDN